MFSIRNRKTFTIVSLLLLPITSAKALSLAEAVDYALRNNPSILSAIADQEALKEQVSQSWGNYLPRVDFRGEIGPEHTEKSGKSDASLATHDYGLSLTQTLFDGGATNSIVGRSNALYKAARFRTEELQSRIALNATESYLELYRLRSLLPIMNSNEEMHQIFLSDAKEKFQGGGGSKTEVTQINSSLISAKNRHLTIKGKVIDAMARYQRVIGVEPEIVELTPPPVSTIPADLQDSIHSARENHPLILSMTSTLKAAKEEKDGSYASMLPTLDLSLNSNDKKNSSGSSSSESNWSALLQVNYNLFRGGADKANIRESARKLIKAEEDLRQAREKSDENVRLAWNALSLAKKRLNINQQQLENAEEQLEESREQFELGNSTKLEILSSENQLMQARIVVVNQQIVLNLNHYRLLNSAGIILANFPALEDSGDSENSRELTDIYSVDNRDLPPIDLERIINEISSDYDISLWSSNIVDDKNSEPSAQEMREELYGRGEKDLYLYESQPTKEYKQTIEHKQRSKETPEWARYADDDDEEEEQDAAPLFNYFATESSFAIEPELRTSSNNASSSNIADKTSDNSSLHLEIGGFLNRLDRVDQINSPTKR